MSILLKSFLNTLDEPGYAPAEASIRRGYGGILLPVSLPGCCLCLCFFNLFSQYPDIDRLLEDISSTQFHGLNPFRHGGVTGKEDDLEIGIDSLEPL